MSKDFKLEVGMFVRIDETIFIITDVSDYVDRTVDLLSMSGARLYQRELNKENYEVSNTYDFKEIIYSNIKKELLTEEEKEIVRKWVDAVGREEVDSIDFTYNDYEDSIYFNITISPQDYATSICYQDKFKNVELYTHYTLEELGL